MGFISMMNGHGWNNDLNHKGYPKPKRAKRSRKQKSTPRPPKGNKKRGKS